jgi:hypothetical protein
MIELIEIVGLIFLFIIRITALFLYVYVVGLIALCALMLFPYVVGIMCVGIMLKGVLK